MSPTDRPPARLARPDRHTVAYHRLAGRAPGVIFCGGFLSDMTGIKATTLERWCEQRDHAFVRFDYLGHGASSGRFEDGTIGRWRDDAIAVLDELSSGPQLLVGSSMGGWIMLLAALARPERIAGLLGIAAAADFTEDLLWRRFDVATRNQLMDEGILYHPSAYGDTPYAITLNLIEEGRQHLLLGQTIPLACPLRLLHGMEDRDVPWQTSLRIVERWAGGDARLTLIKDGEHRLSRAQDLALITATVVELSRLHATEQS